jgi:hypothetical protein
MPRGPRGEKRPADTNACAVKVGRLATGAETEELCEGASPQSAGGKARAARLPAETRRKIASTGAKARWGGKEVRMSEKDKLMHTLFDNPEKELVDIKFCRLDGAKAVSEEAFCARVNQIIFEIDTDLTKASDRFLGDSDKTVDVVELAKRLT